MRIDLHTHILPETWPDWTERTGVHGWIRLEHHKPCCARMLRTERDGSTTFFREIQSNCWDAATRIREIDELMGPSSMQVLSTVPVMFAYWAPPRHALDLARLLNDHIAGVVRDHPARFVGLGTLPMQAPDLAVRELERCTRDLKMPGVQIGTNVNGKNLDDPGVMDVLTVAESLGACVFVHPWDMLARERMPRYWLPWLVGMPAETCLAICSVIFSGVLEKLPRLRLCFAHGGGSFPHTLGRIQHGFEARPDLCAIDTKIAPNAYVRQPDSTPARFYVDSLVHDARALRYLIDLMGADRVALGSDYPFPLGENRPGALIDSMADLSPTDRARLLRGTAREFLGPLAFADA
jgi:aminocarboxymuconate-semialdehyde decarboxylase